MDPTILEQPLPDHGDNTMALTRHSENGQIAIPNSGRAVGSDHTSTQTCPSKIEQIAVPKKRLDHDDYTVCWICPVEIEQIAALIMLDEKHERLPQSPVDHNVYTLGSIGGHNVVVASLHAPGNNPTVTVITQMKNTFKSVRFCLLVGIGGGVPVKTSAGYIHLGHVVVSKPMGTHSGAVQYDHGKAVVDGKFERTGYLQPPPAVLLNAAQDLASSRALEQQDPIAKHVQRFNTTLKGLRRFRHPGSENDMLFPPSYHHPDPKVSCKKCGCDSVKQVRREEDDDDDEIDREEDASWIVVHRGTIASGESVMKDGLQRDRLAEDLGAVCFEMEAAGAMTDFPCLVIRGIADYCDSHKNDKWHGYAAAVAAAYARQLFFHMPVDEVKSCRVPIEALNNLTSRIDEFQFENRQGFDQARFDRIRDWLKAPDVSTNYHRALEKRQEGTGVWFTEGPTFESWKTTPGSFLWLYGNPGCGKTVLSSNIIEACQLIEGPVLAYFFFDFNNSSKQSEKNLLRSLLVQLAVNLENGLEILDALFSSCKNGTSEPSKKTLLETLVHFLGSASEVFLVFDALDECPSREGLLGAIKQIMELKGCNLHLLVTSRPERDIESSFDEWLHQDQSLSMQSDVVDADIHTHIGGCLERDKGLTKWANNPTARIMIEHTLMEKAAGMFQWVACQLDELRNCRTLGELKNALASLPQTLDATYERILQRVDGRDRAHILRILQWLLYSERPLGINELAEALAVRPGERPSIKFENRFEDPLDIFSICSSLIVKTTPSPNDYWESKPSSGEDIEIQLSHFSVKEYLISNRVHDDYRIELETTYAHASIAETCLVYLMHFENIDVISSVDCYDTSTTTKEEAYPLLLYASTYWPIHTKSAEQSAQAEQMTEMTLELLVSMPNAYNNTLEHLETVTVLGPPIRYLSIPKTLPALYLASRVGLISVVKRLLRHGVEVDAVTTAMKLPTALMAASAAGQDEVVSLLLEAGAEVNQCHDESGTPLAAAVKCITTVEVLLCGGADINYQGGSSGNALQSACLTGSIEVCKVLLEAGAAINAQGGKYGNALQAACSSGSIEVCKILLEAGAAVNAQGGQYGNALQAASRAGSIEVCKILFEAGAAVNARGGYYGNALQAACFEGSVELCKVLLEAGAAVNAQGGTFGNALQAASLSGHKTVVQMLLQSEIDVNAEAGYYGNALQAASSRGHEAIAQILLQSGADVNAQGGYYGNALQAASSRGHEAIVQMLLQTKADVNAQGGKYGNALQAASYEGSIAIVQMLLRAGANVNAQGGKYGNALQAASYEGSIAIVQMLLRAGADVNAQGGEYSNALQAASYEGSIAIVQMLLQAGADVNAQGGEYSNALQAASTSWNKKYDDLLETNTGMVEILLSKGADINAKGKDSMTALHIAAEKGNTQVVEILLSRAADINAKNKYTMTALHLAAKKGHTKVVEILISKGADINAKGENSMTALHWAAKKDHIRVVEILWSRGADFNATSEDSMTALHLTVMGGCTQVVEFLLSKGAHIDYQNNQGHSAIYEAASRGHLEAVKVLIEAGCHLSLKTNEGHSPLDSATWNGHLNVVIALLVAGSNPNSRDNEGDSPLHYAAHNGRSKVVKTLLKAGSDLDSKNKEGHSALHKAVRYGRSEVVKLLVAAGSDLNSKNKEGLSALHEAAGYGHSEAVKLLVAAGSDLNLKTDHGSSPLHLAASRGYLNIVKILVQAGSDIESKNSAGMTPLHMAAWEGHSGVVKALLQAGSDTESKISDGMTPLHMAAGYGYLNVVKVLVEAGSSLDAEDNDGMTPLDLAREDTEKQSEENVEEHSQGVPEEQSEENPEEHSEGCPEEEYYSEYDFAGFSAWSSDDVPEVLPEHDSGEDSEEDSGKPDVADRSAVVVWLTLQMKNNSCHESSRNTSMVVWRPSIKQMYDDISSIKASDERRATKPSAGHTSSAVDVASSSTALFHVGLGHAITRGRWKNWRNGV